MAITLYKQKTINKKFRRENPKKKFRKKKKKKSENNYRIVASTNTCYYSENQVFGGVTIRVLCSKRGCY